VQLSILLLSTDGVVAAALMAALKAAGHGVTVVTRVGDLAAAAGGHSLAIIDRVPADMTMPAVIAVIRSDPGIAHLPILAVAPSRDLETRIALLEADADDVITRPFDDQELRSRVEALSLRFERPVAGTLARSTAIGDSDARRVVAVYSPKGGVGSTTIAVNLAVISAETHLNRTLLIDMDLSFGQVASHLNVRPRQTLLELARDDPALHDPELFRAYTVHHDSGLHVLAAPPAPGFAPLITAEHVELLLARAIEAYEVVIVDAGSALDDRLLAILARSDTVIVPVLPEVPALNAVHQLLDQLTETGGVGGTTLFVLNNAFARGLLKRSDIEGSVGAKIGAELPYDPMLYLRAVNEGIPVVRGAPKSIPAERLHALAAGVFGQPRGTTAATVKRERRRLFGRRA
jgi:pilus assembly protein CpaE